MSPATIAHPPHADAETLVDDISRWNAPQSALPAAATGDAPAPTKTATIAVPPVAVPVAAQPSLQAAPAVAEAPAVGADGVATGPLFNVAVASNSLRPKSLSVWEDHIEWNGTPVFFDDVDHFAYEVFRHRTAVLPAHTGYLIVLWVAGHAHTIELVSSSFSRRSTKFDTEMMFEALVSMLHARVGERLMNVAMERLRSGETVAVGNLKMRWSGITYTRHMRERTLSWDDLAGAEFAAGDVILHRYHKDATKPVVHISMAEPNAVLLPDLVHLAAARFNGKRQRRAQIEKMAAAEFRRKSHLAFAG